MAHTFNSVGVQYVKLNGETIGEIGVDALLCCELAKDWKSRLLKEGFAVHSGIMGTAQQAVQAFLTGTLTGCGGEGEGSCGGDCSACGSCDCGCGGH